jgi:hypothetical protein
LQSLSAFSIGASKLGRGVAEVGWKFTEVASQKVTEVSGTVSSERYFLVIGNWPFLWLLELFILLLFISNLE